MLTRCLVRHAGRQKTLVASSAPYTARCLATKAPKKLSSTATPPSPASAHSAGKTVQNDNSTPSTKPVAQEKSWLTQQVQSSPAFRKFFLTFTNALGYGSPKQLAARRALVLYRHVCAIKPDEDKVFWQKDCSLPPTFQSWFTITNLHIWLLTVRLRALPSPLGKHYTQALIDHFFIDIEDRVRAVLQPPAEPTKPYTFHTDFYVNPNAPKEGEIDEYGKQRKRPLIRAPDRLVTRQMKIFKEQWAGMGMSLDLGLVTSDMELAGAVWRNMLGARGAQGIAYPDSASSTTKYHRAVNLVGGEVTKVSKVDVEQEETKDDGSGVHDFPPEEADKYVAYPELMLDVVGYIRRELVRLQNVSDAEIMEGDWEKLRFGEVTPVKILASEKLR